MKPGFPVKSALIPVLENHVDNELFNDFLLYSDQKQD